MRRAPDRFRVANKGMPRGCNWLIDPAIASKTKPTHLGAVPLVKASHVERYLRGVYILLEDDDVGIIDVLASSVERGKG